MSGGDADGALLKGSSGCINAQSPAVRSNLYHRNPMNPRAWVASLTFSDGSVISLQPSDTVVIVGPNNSGKSASLRVIRDRFSNPNAHSPVIVATRIDREGTVADLSRWLPQVAKEIYDPARGTQYAAFGVSVHEQNAQNWWQNGGPSFHDLSRFFCHMLTADERLRAANPAKSIAITREPPTHPIHFLQIDDQLEEQISGLFREAFGMDLIVHRNAGSEVPLLCGDRPTPQENQDRVSFAYVQEVEKLPALSTQGDGMRSFAGILLSTYVGPESVLLIDEPEAFLHPPQARLLGRMLVRDSRTDRQMIVATHSGDVLRGMLDAGSTNLRVVRLQREGTINVARELSASEIAAYWADPLLRYSNILDGIFHERVILCESDGDNRFYAAVLDAVYELGETQRRRPDIMFAHCGGKDRFPTAIRALRSLGVPTAVVADFDVLREERPLRHILEALGCAWTAVETDWKLVKRSIESKKPDLTADEVRESINAVLANTTGSTFPDEAKKEIQRVLRRSSSWATAKEVGRAYVPSGDPTKALERLLDRFHEAGLFVVEAGEMEGFDRSIGSHGPAWVNKVLDKDLGTDPSLEGARKFVEMLMYVRPLSISTSRATSTARPS